MFSEPAPVDFLLMGLILLLPVIGLAPLDRTLIVYLCLWLVVGAGGFVASILAFDLVVSMKHSFITLYLSIASVLLGGFVARAPERHVHLMMSAYTVAAVVATVAGLVGYFGIAFEELFTHYSRARGTFKDPNVFGAFLAPAIVYCVYLWLNRPGPRSLVPLAVAGLLVFGVLLSFSRGAWSNAALSLLTFGYLSFVTAPSNRQQLRLFLLGFFGVIGIVLVVIAALQVDEIRELMQQRAAVTQSYDDGPEGRYGGHDKAKALILENPLGIGARQFAEHYHPEDVHHVYLSMLLNAGWLGGAVYALIVLATFLNGLYGAFRRTCFQGLYLAVYSAYVGTAAEGLIVDTDHWRHFFILLAMVWGMLIAGRREAAVRSGIRAANELPTLAGRRRPLGPAAVDPVGA